MGPLQEDEAAQSPRTFFHQLKQRMVKLDHEMAWTAQKQNSKQSRKCTALSWLTTLCMSSLMKLKGI